MAKRDPNLDAIIRALDPDLLPPPPPPPPFTGREVMIIGGPRARLAVCGMPAPSIEAWERLTGLEAFTDATVEAFRSFVALHAPPRPDPIHPSPEPSIGGEGTVTVQTEQVFPGGLVRMVNRILGREITRG